MSVLQATGQIVAAYVSQRAAHMTGPDVATVATLVGEALAKVAATKVTSKDVP